MHTYIAEHILIYFVHVINPDTGGDCDLNSCKGCIASLVIGIIFLIIGILVGTCGIIIGCKRWDNHNYYTLVCSVYIAIYMHELEYNIMQVYCIAFTIIYHSTTVLLQYCTCCMTAGESLMRSLEQIVRWTVWGAVVNVDRLLSSFTVEDSIGQCTLKYFRTQPYADSIFTQRIARILCTHNMQM